MPYKHGAYGEIVPRQEKIISGIGTIPFYVGTAPVFRMENYKENINTAILIRNLSDAQIKLGYSDNDDPDKFTLSGVVYAHFNNKISPIGPIVVVNVLDPDKHMTPDVTKEVTLINKVGYIKDDVILDSVTVENFLKGTDFKVEYTLDGQIKFTALNDSIISPITVKYHKIDISKILETDIVGTYDNSTDKRTGIQCIQSVYEDLNLVPNILSAPGWNHKPEVEQALVSAAKKFDGHYDAIVVTDIDSKTALTNEAALKWKEDNNFISNYEKLCWPRVKMGNKILWMSILAIVRMQQTDTSNAGVPYESPSNKQIDISGLIVGDNTVIKLNSAVANKLNEKGITTGLYNGGKWVLWGPHMANYDYLVTNKPEEVFDVNIRTNIYLSNDFQLRNAELVDKPIIRNDIDGIINTEQMRLNSLVADGKLLYGKVDFITTSNPISDLIQGDFTFDTNVTNTPPGKSLTNRIQYTSQGISALIGGDNADEDK